MSVKAIALNVGRCWAEPVLIFLRTNNLRGIQHLWNIGNNNHLAEFPELHINRCVWHDNDVYVIDGVNLEEHLIMLHDEEGPEIGTSVGIDDGNEYRVM